MSDDLDDYLAEAMKDPEFAVAYERAGRRVRGNDPFSAMGEAMETVGLYVIRGAERVRGLWRAAGAERRVWIAAEVFFAAWAGWGLVWWLA